MSKQAAQNTTNQITEGVIWKQLLIFFFPILFGTFFQQLYNTADAIIVGNFVGKEALASVGGSASTIINLLVGFFVGLSSGATVIISQYYGADNRRRVSDSVHTAIALAIAGGVVIMLIGLVSARFALTAMGTPDDILSLSLTYMKIYYLGTIPSMIYNMGSGILRAVGDSKRPLYFLIASCLVNIVLDLLFVAVLGMGVSGAAIATIASQFFSAILTLIALLRTQDSYRLIVSKIRFHRDLLFDIIKIGLPAGLQSAMYSISNLLIQSSINSFGTDTIAAWTAYGKVDSIFWMIMGAYGVSITTFAGQNLGAQNYARLKKGGTTIPFWSGLITLTFGLIITAFCRPILMLFTRDAAVLDLAVLYTRIVLPSTWTYAVFNGIISFVNGMGEVRYPTIVNLLMLWAVRIPSAWLINRYGNGNYVVACFPISFTFGMLCMLAFFLTGRWKNICARAAAVTKQPDRP